MSPLMIVGVTLIAVPAVFFAYGYAGYPAILWLLTRGGRPAEEQPGSDEGVEWPTLSISLPAYNEADSIASTLDRLLTLDYPSERRQIVVVSDASTDETDQVVRSYAEKGVELVRLPVRSGKTAAEAAAIPHLRWEIVINTDATIRIHPSAACPNERRYR